MKPNIIIVGGGLSGLSAADKISQSIPDSKLIVLEAKNRVGGRSFSGQIENAWFDYGGMWVGPHQKHVIELANRAKIDLFPQVQKGKKIMELQKKPSVYKSDIPTNVNIIALLQMQYYIFRINRWAKAIPKEDPAKAPLAHYWDAMTVESFIQNHIYFQKVKKLFEIAIRAVFGVEPCELSMLHFLWYVHHSENLENLLEVKEGNQEKKLMKGSQSLCHFLVKEIKRVNKNNEILLNHGVSKIEQNSEKVKVFCQNGKNFEGDYIVFAMPPASLQWIHFQPQLSPEREFINSRNYKGSIIKTLILYKTAFWKEKGFCAECISDCEDGPIFNLFEDTRFKENGEEQPSLVVFTNAAVARHWRNQNDYQEQVLKKLHQWFQCDEVFKPVHFHVQDWDQEEYIRGGPVCVFGPGVLSQMKDRLYKREGRIHFAGTEYASEGEGFLDGAVQSGKRAGQEIIDRIKDNNNKNKVEELDSNQQGQYVDYHQYVKKREEKVPLFLNDLLKFIGILAILYFFVLIC